MIPAPAGLMEVFLKKLIVILLIAGPSSFGFYHYYVDTVSFAELMGKTGSPTLDIFVNLFDFDTGCTRHELQQLSSKCKVWNQEMEQILLIPDPGERDHQHTELVAEMMRDPVFKKLTQKVLGKGAQSLKGILETVSSAQGIGLF